MFIQKAHGLGFLGASKKLFTPRRKNYFISLLLKKPRQFKSVFFYDHMFIINLNKIKNLVVKNFFLEEPKHIQKKSGLFDYYNLFCLVVI